MKVRCLVVDDEPLAIEVLQMYIERVESLTLVATCTSALEAFQYLKSQPVDLLFSDINMAKMSGLELIRTLAPPPKVIFVTAYREYAVESYELNALDYLMKPVSFERFMKAVGKYFDAAKAPENTDPRQQVIHVKSDKKTHRIAIDDILYIESVKDYVVIHTEKEQIASYQPISHLEKELPEALFMRTHRSFLVATDKIRAFDATSVHLATGPLPIGRNFKDEVLRRLGK